MSSAPPFCQHLPKRASVERSLLDSMMILENRSVAGHGSDSFLVTIAALLDVRGIDEPHAIGIGVGGNACCSGRILEDPVAEDRVVIRGLEDMG